MSDQRRSAAQVAFGLLIFPRPAPPAARSATGPKASLDIIIGFVLLTFAAVVIRLELVTLIAPLALDVWLRKTISLKTLVSTGVGGAIPSLSTSHVMIERSSRFTLTSAAPSSVQF